MSPEAASRAASLLIAGKPLIYEGAHDGTARRPAHAFPFDRRAGMQEHPSVHAGDDIPGNAHAHQHRAAPLYPIHHLAVCGIHAQSRSGLPQARNVVFGRLPVEVNDSPSLVADGVGHARQANVEDGEFLSEQVVDL